MGLYKWLGTGTTKKYSIDTIHQFSANASLDPEGECEQFAPSIYSLVLPSF